MFVLWWDGNSHGWTDLCGTNTWPDFCATIVKQVCNNIFNFGKNKINSLKSATNSSRSSAWDAWAVAWNSHRYFGRAAWCAPVLGIWSIDDRHQMQCAKVGHIPLGHSQRRLSLLRFTLQSESSKDECANAIYIGHLSSMGLLLITRYF